jgi:hypothetical protein
MIISCIIILSYLFLLLIFNTYGVIDPRHATSTPWARHRHSAGTHRHAKRHTTGTHRRVKGTPQAISAGLDGVLVLRSSLDLLEIFSSGAPG